MFKTFPIVLDITKHQLNDMFQVNSNDLNTVRLNLSIKSGLEIFDLTGKIVRIAIKKPDGFIAFQTGGVTDPSNGLCEFILDRQAYLVEGKHEAEVMIYQDDSTVIVTERFYYKVNRAIANDKTLISTNHLPALSQAIIAGEQLKDIDIPEFVEAANSAYETIEEAETQGLYAKGQGDYAKQEADRAAARVTELNGVDAVQFKSRQDGFDAQLSETKSVVISIDRFPVQIPETDDTARIQRAIDDVFSKGGGEIRFSPKVYTIKGTLVVKKNVSFLGVAQTNHETNNAGTNHNAVVFKHEPTVAGTDLIVGGTAQAYGYLSGISIKNINLFGTTNSRYALKIDKAGHMEIDGLIISNGFEDGIVCDYYMHCKISNCYITSMKNTPIRFTGAISTTVSIENCYLRGSKWAAILEKESALGVVFTNCVFESCTDGGVDIHVDNKVSFVNPYFENVPSVAGAKPMIQIGVNGTPKDPARPYAVVAITGGSVAGINGGTIDAGSSAIKCDKVALLSVIGTEFMRTGQLITTTANTKLATFTGINETQVTSTKSGIVDNSKVLFLGYNENGTSFPYLFVPEIRFNQRSKWKIAESFTQTDGDLQFSIAGTFPFWLDAQKNIRHNFPGAIGNTNQVDAYGAVTPPTWTGTSAGAFTWAENVDGVIRLRERTSNGKIGDISRFVPVPISDTSPGITGDWSADANNLWVCHAPDTWKKISINETETYLKSPDGSRFRLTIGNDGAITTTKL